MESFAHEALLLQLEPMLGTRKALGSHGAMESEQPQVLPPLPAPFIEILPQQSSIDVAASVQHESLQYGSPSAAELEHFRLLKEMRKSGFRCKSQSFSGIADTETTFKFDCRLWRAAREWSAKMGTKNFFSHVLGDSNPCSRTSEQGLVACAENIAAGSNSPQKTLEQFQTSDDHCVNMMNPRHNRFAVGYVMTSGSAYSHYWTQSMGNDDQAPDQSCLAGNESPQPRPTPKSERQPETDPDASCEDEDPNCAANYEPYCDSQRIKMLCRKTCGACELSALPEPPQAPESPPPQTVPEATCKDADPNCAGNYEPYCSSSRIKSLCRKTCDACQVSALPEPPSQVPESPQPRTVSDALCKDEDPNCAGNYEQYCKSSRIKKLCQKTCGVCQVSPLPEPQAPESLSPPPQTVPDALCKDEDPNCAGNYEPYCDSNRIKKLCQKTCGACSDLPSSETAPCQDADPNCAGNYEPYCDSERIKGLCRKTCGACQVQLSR